MRNYETTMKPFPLLQSRPWVKEAFIVFLGGAFISLFGSARFYLPFTPVPIALQPQLVLFLALIMGSRRAALSTLFFLTLGAMGMPVFTGGGGLLRLVSPTGGYLVGYLVAAFVTGFLVEKGGRLSKARAFLFMLVGSLVIYLFGMAWLSTFLGAKKAFILGVLPFLLGDLIKCYCFSALFSVWKERTMQRFF